MLGSRFGSADVGVPQKPALHVHAAKDVEPGADVMLTGHEPQICEFGNANVPPPHDVQVKPLPLYPALQAHCVLLVALQLDTVVAKLLHVLHGVQTTPSP